MQYAVTSARRDRADAARLLSWLRGRWEIENRCFWVRDVVLGEDACRIRSGAAPHALSVLRNAALNFLRVTKAGNLAAALRANALKVNRLLAQLGISTL